MTQRLYDNDSFLKNFTATVLECEKSDSGWVVVLDKTAFFPEAGGQKSDKGTLGEALVLDARIKNETIFHITDKPLQVGETVEGEIDFERRFDFMQQHSAEHIVSGIANALYGCENVGFHLSEDIVTLDFDKLLNEAQVLEIEKQANQKVYENVAFNCFYPDDETLKSLNYRSKKELEGDIRIVEIENTDMCACCAPHVKTAGQIGLIKLLGTEKLRGGIRIELKAGNRALEDYNEKYQNVRKISSLLATAQNETALGVERLLDTLNEQKAQITALRYEIIKLKSSQFVPESDKTAVFENDFSIKDLQMFADSLHKLYGGIRGVFAKTESGFDFCICGENLDAFFGGFKSAFDVKGGGRNGMVQGKVSAEKTQIEDFFKKA
ncbi:MAG: alanyl-tRNA editing protein [Clostridia bacterium]|nr:alanyl-tRNA editing protein [Clostridia bacterium]